MPGKAGVSDTTDVLLAWIGKTGGAILSTLLWKVIEEGIRERYRMSTLTIANREPITSLALPLAAALTASGNGPWPY